MKLKKARQLLQLDLNNPGSIDIRDLHQARTLAIQAIQRIEEGRQKGYDFLLHALPSENEG